MENVGVAEMSKNVTVFEDCTQVLGGTDTVELVGNEKAVISKLVEDTFEELLYHDDDESVVVTEAELAFPDSFCVYSKVLNIEPEKLNETEFKGMLTDILLGMAAGLRRDPTVILRMEGDDLREFISSQTFESEAVCIFSQIQAPDKSIRQCLASALEKLTVDHGMPPTSDSWVTRNIVEPVLEYCNAEEYDLPISEETFLMEFKKAALDVAQRLKAQPVIVAHNENVFDGSGIKRLLSNKFELDKVLNSAMQAIAQHHDGKISKDHLPLAINAVAQSADLPPVGTFDQMDKVLTDSFKKLDLSDENTIDENEYKKTLTEVLESLMENLEANPITLTSDLVVHEYLESDFLLTSTS
ncbi:hypothetical protein QQ045_029509 [Rhodiola kirilowii]